MRDLGENMNNINVNFYFKRTDPIDYNIPFHTHKCYELVYYYTGKGHCLIGEQEFSYERNHYVVIPPHTKHNDVHEENCKILCIGFTLDREEGEIPAGSYADENRNVMNYLKFVSAEFKDRREDFVSVISNLLGNVIVEIKRTSSCLDKASPHQDVLEQAINYINEYFLTEITPEQLANITNYSYHRFRHIFKNAMGIPPKQYVIIKRLEYAKTLLANSHASVTEIGYQCGFACTSLFIKQFKKNMDVTPAQYRRQLRSNVVFSSEQSLYENQSRS